MHRLKINNISKSIKGNDILTGVSLEVKSGEVVGLLGPNGAGKTTTFYCVCGLVSPTSGEVFFDEQNITKEPLHKRALIGVGYLPQESSVFKDLTVEENLLLAGELSIKDKNKRHERIDDLLEMFDIEPIRKQKGVSLSGGERRRVEIARSLVPNPRFLLLDEPFAGVDPLAVKDIQTVISQLVKIGIGVLITDHNVRETIQICSRVYVIKSGKLLASGTAQEIKKNDLVRKNYLGEDFTF